MNPLICTVFHDLHHQCRQSKQFHFRFQSIVVMILTELRQSFLGMVKRLLGQIKNLGFIVPFNTKCYSQARNLSLISIAP